MFCLKAAPLIVDGCPPLSASGPISGLFAISFLHAQTPSPKILSNPRTEEKKKSPLNRVHGVESRNARSAASVSHGTRVCYHTFAMRSVLSIVSPNRHLVRQALRLPLHRPSTFRKKAKVTGPAGPVSLRPLRGGGEKLPPLASLATREKKYDF